MKMNQEEKIQKHLDSNMALEGVSELVHTRLVDCGWRDQVRLACRKFILETPDQIPSVDDIINEVTASARSMVPDSVKKELLHELEKILVGVDKVAH